MNKYVTFVADWRNGLYLKTYTIISSMTPKEYDHPMVSVIVPNYNYSRYLRERIDSILRQTYTDYELILLDDASTDNSADILMEYKDNPHVSHIIVNRENTGSPFKQWMKGISLSRGKYIWIAEADDSAEPDFLETCVGLAEQHTDTAVCYADSILIDSEGKAMRKRYNHRKGYEKKGFSYFDGKLFAEYNLYWRNYIVNASGAIFSRAYAGQLAQSPFLSMKYCGDWLFWFEMAMQGCVIEVYKPLNYFRQHAHKVTISSHKEGNGVKEDIVVVDIMEQRLPHLSQYKKRLRHGLLYKKIKRLKIDKQQKKVIYDFLSETLGSGISDYYLERRNKFLKWLLPSLITMKRERLQ